jgi:hypothetical protein
MALGLTVWVSMPISVLILDGNLHSWRDWVEFVILAVLTIVVDTYFVQAVWQSGRLRADARLGHVIIVSQDEEPSSPLSTANDHHSTPTIIELLPTSRWMWTEDGQPAPWRVVRSALA